MNEALIKYLLSLGDTSLILGQRLGEWCGHGPVLEQDIAMTNISLDYIGRARLLYQYVCELRNDGQNEDQIAFMREEEDYLNLLLAEYPNKDFAYTIARQFFWTHSLFRYLKNFHRHLMKNSHRLPPNHSRKVIITIAGAANGWFG